MEGKKRRKMDKWMYLNEAISVAASAHAGQTRKGTKIPYIVHPLEVLAIVAGMTEDVEVNTLTCSYPTIRLMKAP